MVVSVMQSVRSLEHVRHRVTYDVCAKRNVIRRTFGIHTTTSLFLSLSLFLVSAEEHVLFINAR